MEKRNKWRQITLVTEQRIEVSAFKTWPFVFFWNILFHEFFSFFQKSLISSQKQLFLQKKTRKKRFWKIVIQFLKTKNQQKLRKVWKCPKMLISLVIMKPTTFFRIITNKWKSMPGLIFLLKNKIFCEFHTKKDNIACKINDYKKRVFAMLKI